MGRVRLIALLGGLALAAGCAFSTGTLPTAGELAPAGDAEAFDALERGRALTVRECTACHRMFWPEEYTPESWIDIGADMAARSGLGRSDAELVVRYLTAASQFVREAPSTR